MKIADQVEGKARLSLPMERVFYNPKMSFNRDMAILFTSAYFQCEKPLHFCDPMTASGVRAIRYALECSAVDSVVAADSQSESLRTARTNVELNGLNDKITLTESDANLVLNNYANNRFDMVDLDPFGSPAPFFESALRATTDGGIVAATATDMAPLTGARHAACLRKYGITPLRTEFSKEMAIRVLSASLAISAGRLELGVEIAFSHANDHYARIFATVRKGKKVSNQSSEHLGFLEYCAECLARSERASLNDIRSRCDDCGAKTQIGGPIWLGRLSSEPTVSRMIETAPNLATSRLSEIQTTLAIIDEEHKGSAFHFRTDSLSKVFHIKPPSIRDVLAKLHAAGFQASRTHFHPTGFRTDAHVRELRSVLRGNET